MQSRGRVGKAALLRLPARPSAPPSPAGHHPCPAAGGVVSGVPLPPDLPATFLRGWVRGFGAGEGVLSAPPPHPTLLCPWRRPRLPSPRPRTSRRGSSGRVSRAVRPDGWGLPAAGAACLPVASRRWPWTGLPRPVVGRPLLWACRAVARRLPTPSEPRGLLPTPLPHASRGCLVRFSRPLTSVVSLARLAPRCLSEPLPSALGGGGRRMPGARAGDPGGCGERSGGGGCGRTGGAFFFKII